MPTQTIRKATKGTKPPKRESKAHAQDYQALLMEDLRDPTEAAAYLDAAISEGDAASLLIALRNVAAAHGGVRAVAQSTGLSRESLYRALSRKGNPTIGTLNQVLAATGLRLSVHPA